MEKNICVACGKETEIPEGEQLCYECKSEIEKEENITICGEDGCDGCLYQHAYDIEICKKIALSREENKNANC